MQLIDTHCHLDARSFAGGPEPVIERARACGVTRLVCIGVGGAAASADAVRLATSRIDVRATVGVHPHDASTWNAALDVELTSLSRAEQVAAVGEVGLDYHYDHSPRDVQRRVFARFIALAREIEKPLVIHTRSASRETLELLESEGACDVGGVIHCFSEDRAFARRALELGFDLSFSGILTFKNAHAVHDVAVWAPEDRILVETDSPYLAPVPLRGKRCEPAFVLYTARRLAELRNTTLDAIAAATTQNALRRFGVFGPPATADGRTL